MSQSENHPSETDTESREIQLHHIANTQDTEDPVLRVTLGESFADIIVDTEKESLNVWYVQSVNQGDMKRMLDYIVTKTGLDWLQFIAPMDKKEKDLAEQMASRLKNVVLGNQDGTRLCGPSVPTGSTDPPLTTGRDIEDVLDGFQHVVEDDNGEKIPMLVGFWDADRNE